MKLNSKNVKYTCFALAITALSGCTSEGDRALIQSYANQAGVTYQEAQSSMRVVQGALKNLGFYSGRINGIPSVETNDAMQAYVNEQRRKTRSSVTGAPRASEIAKLISEYESFLESLNSSDGADNSDSGFSAEMESRSDSYSSDPVSVSNTGGALTSTVSGSPSAQSSSSATSSAQPSSGGGSTFAGSRSSYSQTSSGTEFHGGTVNYTDGTSQSFDDQESFEQAVSDAQAGISR